MKRISFFFLTMKITVERGQLSFYSFHCPDLFQKALLQTISWSFSYTWGIHEARLLATLCLIFEKSDPQKVHYVLSSCDKVFTLYIDKVLLLLIERNRLKLWEKSE